MEQIRSMWCDLLEELLQCPICLEIKSVQIFQCSNGHHMCTDCKQRLQCCPLCKSCFINTRNLAVEQVMAKFMDIKTSLLHPYHAINRQILKNKKCAETQTENITFMSSSCQTADSAEIQLPIKEDLQPLSPKVARGTYPCRINSCTKNLHHGRMIGHLRYYHEDKFCEFKKRSIAFQRNWHLEYAYYRNYSFAIYIRGMGLFFLNVSIGKGDVTAMIQIVNSSNVGKQFNYSLEIGYGKNKKWYNGTVKSCRVQREQIHSSRDCLYVRDDIMHRIVNKNTFNCDLSLKYKPNNVENIDQDGSIESES